MLISRLVRSEKVLSQVQLSEMLQDNGIRVGQPTISRDIADLNLIKVLDGYYAFPNDAILMDASKRYVTSAELIQNMAVLRTRPFAAQIVAKMIDTVEFRGCIGSVLGNDTVMVVCRGPESAAEIVGFIRNYIEEEPSFV